MPFKQSTAKPTTAAAILMSATARATPIAATPIAIVQTGKDAVMREDKGEEEVVVAIAVPATPAVIAAAQPALRRQAAAKAMIQHGPHFQRMACMRYQDVLTLLKDQAVIKRFSDFLMFLLPHDMPPTNRLVYLSAYLIALFPTQIMDRPFGPDEVALTVAARAFLTQLDTIAAFTADSGQAPNVLSLAVFHANVFDFVTRWRQWL